MSRFDAIWDAADFWQRLGLVGFVVAAIFQAPFIIIYLSRRTWWFHFAGRALALKSTSLGMILWLSIINLFFRYPGQEQVSACLTWLLAFAVIYQLAALLKTPRYATPPDDRTTSDD